MARIENGFELAEDSEKRPSLPAYPGCTRQPRAVLRADGASEIEDEFIYLVGQLPQPRAILWSAPFDKRPHMNLAGGGMDEVRCRDFMALKQFLNAVQVARQQLGRHSHVLNESERLDRAAQAIQAREGGLAHLPQTFPRPGIARDMSEEG